MKHKGVRRNGTYACLTHKIWLQLLRATTYRNADVKHSQTVPMLDASLFIFSPEINPRRTIPESSQFWESCNFFTRTSLWEWGDGGGLEQQLQYREGTKTAGQKNSRNSRRPKFLIQPGANNFKTAGGQKPKIQPGGKRPKSDKTAGVEKSSFF